MAEPFPRAGKTEAGGTKVISSRSFSCRTSALTNAAPKYSLELLKKSGVKFYTSVFCKVRALIAGQNRFSQRKNLSNTSEIRWSPKRRNTRQKGALVTTNHVLLPSPRRKAVALLPISQPISKFSRSQVASKGPRGGAGGSVGTQPPKALDR
jgi:hypothetical protein